MSAMNQAKDSMLPWSENGQDSSALGGGAVLRNLQLISLAQIEGTLQFLADTVDTEISQAAIKTAGAGAIADLRRLIDTAPFIAPDGIEKIADLPRVCEAIRMLLDNAPACRTRFILNSVKVAEVVKGSGFDSVNAVQLLLPASLEPKEWHAKLSQASVIEAALQAVLLDQGILTSKESETTVDSLKAELALAGDGRRIASLLALFASEAMASRARPSSLRRVRTNRSLPREVLPCPRLRLTSAASLAGANPSD